MFILRGVLIKNKQAETINIFLRRRNFLRKKNSIKKQNKIFKKAHTVLAVSQSSNVKGNRAINKPCPYIPSWE